MKNITFILFFMFFLFGCKDTAYYYNYGGMKSAEELQKEEDIWLARKTLEEREKYRRNVDTCYDRAKTIQKRGGKKHFNVYYNDCMKELGGPIFEW
ncbi:Uncharacterised protein [Phocoenobacter uteri]|uniref:Lipoprotein n=1 Tax=Phocoenobacter uteri TaxID=146806 RepID=A0A379C9V2_9PAST|nr:hypothetical protein [Phocoenobacter uteri]MDG6881140.1 hypothetical protein [Phocoenobacter uteri]SUB59162.1 Uncharacterised protein [Phocoenobacter uteri]